ncbi:MAG: holo-ACP synthase [Ferrovum sp. 37-45-19]|jgi:holo-[acyl-carrier protein] synthase|uniref:holo-ACP synthase n=1 Tax=Ferrovum sp. JA12 TaxID=1356299 RepID=UPI00070262B0|nr:holo-ACP synthase [Ferrovum sp. JA12]OYV80309.1 MAG: holo-ACP synthase [Ferrovum sp. 21-44-67]OYV95055.1 MAG: holo-ACP synthase [Ferrovum sp. 37-45-19]OZB33613.1 MAG: holo-ACP synthase [Ferrovum sp. 34-44-207]HQT80886.1 holo-ACP synthase [Ferrovaceae bacterium]KRH78728.1 holo-[acyl-carrier-protein] synthase [Ferrovum sp. JA12]
MIVGIGIDTVKVSRIQQALMRFGQRFAEKILTTDELIRFRKHGQPARYLAKRFAVKEAFSKAIGTGIRTPVTWKNIGTKHHASGAPFLQFSATLSELVIEKGITKTHLTVTDEENLAIAFVILEGD